MLGENMSNKSLNLAIVKGDMFKSLESTKLGGSKNYLTESLIQFVINWLFWDDNSLLTQQFHVVPMVVVLVVTQWLQGNSKPSVAGKILDQYCQSHWRSLDSFMIFYVQNIGNYHWVLDIAVNPYCMLSMITSETTKGLKTIYGFMRIDPLEDKFWDRTIPSSVNFPQDSPVHVCSLIFLLNYMSRYRNLFIHDLLKDYVPLYSSVCGK
jgi:hypothetical protein